MSLKIEIKFDENELKKLAKIPEFVRFQAGDRALRAMGKPVLEKALLLAPSSRQVAPMSNSNKPSREKWGKKYKTDSKWQIDSGKELGQKVAKVQNGSILFVGANYPRGNKQQFNSSPKGRKEVFWGRPQGTIYKPPVRFMQRAFDETRSAQNSAFIRSLERSLRSMNLG
jgi:hypothetical protein